MSGTPFSVTADSTPCNCPGNSTYAEAVRPTRILGGLGPRQLWFDTSAFAQPGANRFGTASRNSVRGPGYATYGSSIFRVFPARERAKLEFRAEFYNLTKSPIFGNPSGDVNSGSFGTITSAGGERQIQFGLRLLCSLRGTTFRTILMTRRSST